MKKKTERKSKDELFVEAMEDWDDDLIAGYRLAVIKSIGNLSLEDFKIWWGILIKEKLDLPVDQIRDASEIVAEIIKSARKELKKAGQNEETAQHEEILEEKKNEQNS